MGRRIQFILHVPKGMKIHDISRVDERIIVDVREGLRRIDKLSLRAAKQKYG